MGGGHLRPADVVLGQIAATFGHRLHEAGVPVTPQRSARFADALSLAVPTAMEEVYWLGRVTLVAGPEQFEVYDQVFHESFIGRSPFDDDMGAESDKVETDVPEEPAEDEDDGVDSDEEGETPAPPGDDATDDEDGGPEPGSAPAAPGDQDAEPEDDAEAVLLVSAEEVLGAKDFAACSEEELALLSLLVNRLRLVPPPRRSRRLRRHAGGHRLDIRATLRESRRTAGDPVDLVMRRRKERPRRVVLVADVSGSMEPYARLYLHLMRGAVRAVQAEAFVFATRLTRVTKVLATRDADAAYRQALDAAPDWSGGTRIGQALDDFIDLHGRRGTARGAIVVIVSDGWELDDPELVGESMRRLSLLAHHVVWVNPRKAAAGYEPRVGGMAAAMPYVDTFVSGHSLEAIEEVMAAIRAADRRST